MGMKQLRLAHLVCLTTLAMAVLAKDGERGLAKGEETPAVEPVLPTDPAVLAAVDALGDNSACVLGDPTVRQELGDFAKGWHRMKEHGPGGRDYTIKMAWMPDRRRAFFCGANHGSPHRFNDAWEYDLAANTWVLLYVPDYNDRGAITDYDRQVLTLDNGWLRTRRGGPAHPAHTWWGLTYDPTIRAAIWYCAWPSYRLDAKLTAIGKTREDLYRGRRSGAITLSAASGNRCRPCHPGRRASSALHWSMFPRWAARSGNTATVRGCWMARAGHGRICRSRATPFPSRAWSATIPVAS
jgi:hypothetical protein